MHGLLGFFTARLYGDIVIDTRPRPFAAAASPLLAPPCKKKKKKKKKDLPLHSRRSDRYISSRGRSRRRSDRHNTGSRRRHRAQGGRNCMHWEAMFFPFAKPLVVPAPVPAASPAIPASTWPWRSAPSARRRRRKQHHHRHHCRTRQWDRQRGRR